MMNNFFGALVGAVYDRYVFRRINEILAVRDRAYKGTAAKLLFCNTP